MRGPSAAALAAALVPALAPAPAAAAPRQAVESVVRLSSDDRPRLALRDFDGDGDLDLLHVSAAGATVAPLGDDGRLALAPLGTGAPGLAWPEGRVGWDLTDLDGDGVTELALLTEADGVQVFRYRPADAEGPARFGAGEQVLATDVWLPRGVSRVRFARDVDGDGREDLVVPGPGAHRIHLRTDEGYAPPLEVRYELEAELLVGDPRALSSRLGQEVRVPWFRIEDVDGDGRRDLVAETDDRVAFHLARPELSAQPTWVLSLEDLRAELPQRTGVDLDDLFSVVDRRVAWRLADLDGEAPRDLLVQVGSKFRVYLGGAATGPGDAPDQLLKSSGNVLWAFVRQVQGDPLPDLQLVRAERVSIGRVVRSLILPSSLDFDLYTYANEGGAFSRSPTRRNKLVLEIPRLLSFIEDAEGFGDALEAQSEIPATRLPRTPGRPAAGDAVLDVEGESIAVYPGCAPEPLLAEDVVQQGLDAEQLIEAYFLRDFDRRDDGAQRTLDLGDLLTLELASGAVLRRSRQGVDPSLRQPLAFPADVLQELRAADLDADGTTDVIAVGRDGEAWIVQLLVLRP